MAKTLPIFVRDSQIQHRDLTARTIQVRSATINEEERSIEAVLATETPAYVFDMRSWEVIEEVLIVRGAEIPAQLPLLAAHDRWSLDSVLGSWRNIRLEGDQIVGRMHFVKGDPEADSAWNKVRQGHLTDVSVGYAVKNYVDIPAGQTQTVNGRSFTAKNRTLRVSTEWTPKEGSLVPIGADPSAKTRELGNLSPLTKEIPNVNPQLRAYLVSLGMRSDATDQDANEFLSKLGQAERSHAETLKTQAQAAPPAPAPSQGQQSDPPASPPATAPATPPVNLDAARAEERAAERSRIMAIREMAGSDVPATLVDQAINEGWAVARYAPAFAGAIRAARNPSQANNPPPAPNGEPNRAPAGHVRSREQLCTRENLALAIFQRGANSNESAVVQLAASRVGIRQDWEVAAERADMLRSLSMLDICREAIRLDGNEVPVIPEDCYGRALSGGTLANIFTTSSQASLMQGWDETPDTTVGLVEVTEKSNFKTNDEIDYQANARLKRHERGGTAKDASVEDTKESWKLARYSNKFSVDEMDVIDDNFDVITTMPRSQGSEARQICPDLVYSLILANPTLARDTRAVFEATYHKNYGTTGTAFAASTVEAGIVAMAKQIRNNKTRNIKARHLVVPVDLKFTAEILLQSAERIISSASGGTYNPLKDAGLILHVENRMGADGVWDPSTDYKTQRTGSATNWLLSSGPGNTIKVGYRTGTGRGPRTRTYILDRGQWGWGCDVNLDIGAVILDYMGLYYATGGA